MLIWWYEERIKEQMRGYSGLVVYADDFVVCFQYKDDAEKFYELLKRRMKHFGLSLEEEKSRLIEFRRFAEENRRRKGKGKPAEPKKPEAKLYMGEIPQDAGGISPCACQNIRQRLRQLKNN